MSQSVLVNRLRYRGLAHQLQGSVDYCPNSALLGTIKDVLTTRLSSCAAAVTCPANVAAHCHATGAVWRTRGERGLSRVEAL